RESSTSAVLHHTLLHPRGGASCALLQLVSIPARRKHYGVGSAPGIMLRSRRQRGSEEAGAERQSGEPMGTRDSVHLHLLVSLDVVEM
ncbi:hypothetical protein NHX12_028315, partial [Muraenolepis orangiensis]